MRRCELAYVRGFAEKPNRSVNQQLVSCTSSGAAVCGGQTAWCNGVSPSAEPSSIGCREAMFAFARRVLGVLGALGAGVVPSWPAVF